jgi:hypothetical protein
VQVTTDTETTAARSETALLARTAPGGGWWRSAWTLPEVRWASAATVLFLAGMVVDLAGTPSVLQHTRPVTRP